MGRLLAILLALAAVAAHGQTLTADEIMRRVAANQDRAVEMRKAFVFEQKARVRLTKASGKLKREETRLYRVAPTEEGVERELLEVDIIHRKDGESLELVGVGELAAEDVEGIDADLAESFHEDLAGDDSTRDGVKADLFPLTSREQPYYRFDLDGSETYRGREVYRILFEPVGVDGRGKPWSGRPWRGEVLVDKIAFQPVVVTSELDWAIPLWVRTVFGVNIRQLGFKLTYEEFDDGVWFPVTYGGEFRIKALQVFRRRAALSLVNRDFRRTRVDSSIEFAVAEPPATSSGRSTRTGAADDRTAESDGSPPLQSQP